VSTGRFDLQDMMDTDLNLSMTTFYVDHFHYSNLIRL